MAGAGGGAPGAGAGPLIPPTPLTETTGYKRKRDQDDISDDRIPQPPPPQSGTGTPINYLSRANPAKLRLIQDDNDAFSHVLSLMSDYEGVLSRHESLAANLGARLTAPRLLRAMEGLFESPITVTAQSPYKDSPSSTWYTPSWLDIVSFANANPADFNLTATADGRRVCRFLMNNTRVEISEADWRLVMSGTLDRFRLVPPHPLEEDEMAELATLEILEQRLHTLIKKADEVARRARQLNYHLSGRKAVIATRRPSSGQGSRSGHESANQQPPTRLGGLDPGYDLHADLLQQFLTPVPPVPPHQAPALVIFQSPVTASITHTPSELLRLPPTPSTTTQQPAYTLPQTSPTPTVTPPTYRGSIGPGTAQDPPSTALRRLIQARLDKLTREDNIRPPCDRCRRLRMACIKHRSACQGCTRKHARCTWNYVTDEEATMLTDEHVPGGGSPAATSDYYLMYDRPVGVQNVRG
ncbi:hypothetical protein B0T17DRAFT_610540 [Bombardia bombarda]|uniref:Zn(2)-C6 fungal-type domain-containing protein n=1 Tax=Bombardia bombarda TaxID=252184 RepID=A0AA39U5Q0_9PEZI|nr:hypothetical protein B0T17DRAFT_610540 [Bombardia bombarda]